MLGKNKKQKKDKEKKEEKIELEKTDLGSLPEITEPANEWMEEAEGQLAIDVYQTPKEVIIKAPIAGVKSENIDVAINDDMVTIKGERKIEQEVKEDNYYCQECYWGAFSRSVILPVTVAVEKSKAKLKDGILTVTLPKARSARAKKIRVRNITSQK